MYSIYISAACTSCSVDLVVTHPCMRSPCGPYSQCRNVNGHAVCSCLTGYFGQPPNCHPECTSNSDCPLDKSCINQHCANPCTSVCGYNALCHCVNHNPICSCKPGYSGDPFINCIEHSKIIVVFHRGNEILCTTINDIGNEFRLL